MDMFGNHVLYTSTKLIDSVLHKKYTAVFRLRQLAFDNARTTCITLNGRRATLKALISFLTWHNVHKTWQVRLIFISILKSGIL